MIRKDINTLLRFYDCTTRKSIDYTKEGMISVFRAIGQKHVEEGEELFKFKYTPLLESCEYLKLLKQYENAPFFVELYNYFSSVYFFLLESAFKWYFENTKVYNAFDNVKQLDIYDTKYVNDFSCPIVSYLETDSLNNINFYQNIQSLYRYSEQNDIKLVGNLIYIDDNEILFKKQKTALGKIALNSIVNIVYLRFRPFLMQPQIKTKNNKIKGPSIALFCSILNQSGVIKKGFDESPEIYIKRVSTIYKLESNPAKARQYFNEMMDIKTNDKYLKIIISHILPTLPKEAVSKINNFIESKKLNG